MTLISEAKRNLKRWQLYVGALLSLAGYCAIGYFTQRHDTHQLVLLYILLWIPYAYFCLNAESGDLKILLILGLLCRLSLFFSIPTLSDDFYRFIWDGRLLSQGIHPFTHLPSYYIEIEQAIPGINETLFEMLNSKGYFTIYPPVCQFIFSMAALVAPDSIIGSVMVIRTFIGGAEIGSIFLILKLIGIYKLPTRNVLLYALNPLVILELTGNLHFEALMVFFSLAAIYYLKKKRQAMSAIMLALAVASKLLPLIYLPLVYKRVGASRFTKYIIITLLFSLLLFSPLLTIDLIKGMQKSLVLYFQKFEFNASIYYLLRQLGFWILGFNTITYLGIGLAIITFAAILYYTVYERKTRQLLPEAMLMVNLIYLLFATTVHPWYIIPLLALGAVSQIRFQVVWSFIIFFTYVGYSSTGFRELYWIVWAEYLIAIGYLLYEIAWLNSKPPSGTAD